MDPSTAIIDSSQKEPLGQTLSRSVLLTRLGALWAILSLAFAAFIVTSFFPALYDETDSQYSGAAKEMIQSGDWLIPTNNQVPRLHKPPLVYWTQIASMRVFGINEFAARLPLDLATIGWVLMMYLIIRELAGSRLALKAAALLSTMTGFFIFTHIVMPEPMLGFFLAVTFYAFIRGWKTPGQSHKWFLLAWAAMGLGTMCKGLHAMLYPLAVAGVVAWLKPGSRSFWKGLFSLQGAALFLLIVVPWYAYVEYRFHGFLWNHIVNEQIGHMFHKRWPPSANQVPHTIFWPQHLVLWLPWSLFIPAAIVWWRTNRAKVKFDPVILTILGAWAGVTFLSVVFSSRQDYYTMTAWGVVAIFLALPWWHPERVKRVWFMVPCVLIALAGVAGFCTLPLIHAAAGTGGRTIPTEERDRIFSTLSGLSADFWQSQITVIQIASFSFLVGGILAGYWVFRHRIHTAFNAIACMVIVNIFMAMWSMALIEQYFTLKQVAIDINHHPRQDLFVVCEGRHHVAASLFFYCDRKIHWVNSPLKDEFVARELKIADRDFISEEKLAKLWNSDRPVILITEESNLPSWQEKLGLDSIKIYSRSGTRVALMNESAKFVAAPPCH
ncbi:glycosyltransferase family 39 protein [Kamptonema cortianum]|nr:glycosyltransferase family 39 protein [Kamptonema cortianum]MDL5050332.1 glycosyltransferase family 39 protein [Oscillatoria amoena NRMC-F 0135]